MSDELSGCISDGNLYIHMPWSKVACSGVACLKLNVRNCGNVVYAFMQMIPKREHLQIV